MLHLSYAKQYFSVDAFSFELYFTLRDRQTPGDDDNIQLSLFFFLNIREVTYFCTGTNQLTFGLI